MSQLQPRLDLSDISITPPLIEDDNEDDLTLLAKTATQTRLNDSNVVPEDYIPETLCDRPRLPSNVSFKFPETLKSAIDTFQNKSNNIKTRISNQRLVERYLVERGTCSRVNPEIADDMRLRLFTIDGDVMEDVLDGETALNSNLHDNISCAVDAIIMNNKLPGGFAPLQRERVRNWFESIKQIGKPSVEGYAFSTSFTDDTNLFVMKAPRNPKNDELIHEAVVGFYAMNKLRHILPNYMYVYGYVNCSPPAVVDKNVATWCSSSNPGVSYLISENIRDAVPIGDFVTNPETTPMDLMAVWYQIENALNLANKRYGYTHYDLHYENILVRKYRKLIAIPYFSTNNDTKIYGYIVTQYVPYIIDYGYSRVTIGGVGFGKIGLENAGIDGARSYPMYDTYKLLGFLGERLFTRPKTRYHAEIVDILENLFSFFRDGPLIDRVRRRLNAKYDWYTVPRRFRRTQHDTYIRWMENNTNIPDPVHGDISHLAVRGIYAAPINTAIDTCDFYDLVTLTVNPRNSLEYCEVISAIEADKTLTDKVKQEAINWLNTHFDADKYFKSSYQEVYSELNRLMILQNGGNIPVLSDVANIRSSIFVERYRRYIVDVLRIKDITSKAIAYIRASICSLIQQGKYNANSKEIDKLNTLTKEWVDYINRQRSILSDNENFVASTNWSRVGIARWIQEFWDIEHGNLILAL